MRIPGRAALGVASLFLVACSGGSEPLVGVVAVSPAAAYNELEVSLVIEGGPFRPAYDIDTGAGRASSQLGAFSAYLEATDGASSRSVVESVRWLTESELAGALRAHLPAGVYDVGVRDPRGTVAVGRGAFTSLGPDVTPPTVVIIEPAGATVVNAGAEVPVAFEADDGAGRLESLRWMVSSPDTVPLQGTCPPASNPHHATCRFVFVVPQPALAAQALNVTVLAQDAHTVAAAGTTLVVGVEPKVTAFFPREGAAVGGTTVVVTGDLFITGSRVLVGGQPLEPGGGTVLDEHHIVGATQLHAPGLFPVVVETGALTVKAPGAFEFIARPLVLGVSPTTGSRAGGTPLVVVGKNFREGVTRLFFGTDADTAVELKCATVVSANRIEGFAPPGEGAASVFASDPVSGTDELPLAFAYGSEDQAPDGGALAPGGPSCGDGGAP